MHTQPLLKRKRATSTAFGNCDSKRVKHEGASCKTVKVIVGRARRCFHIGVASLVTSSKFFEAALKFPWTPTQQPLEASEAGTIHDGSNFCGREPGMYEQREIDLTFISPKSFLMYLEFIRLNTLESGAYLLDQPDTGEEDDVIHEKHHKYGHSAVATSTTIVEGPKTYAFDILLHAFVTGDFLQAPYFQNAIMKEIAKLFRFLWKSFGIVLLYPLRAIWNELTVDSESPLRRILLDVIFANIPWRIVLEAIREELIPYDMSLEFAALGFERSQESGQSGAPPWEKSPRSYHYRSQHLIDLSVFKIRTTCSKTLWDIRYEWDEEDPVSIEEERQAETLLLTSDGTRKEAVRYPKPTSLHINQ